MRAARRARGEALVGELRRVRQVAPLQFEGRPVQEQRGVVYHCAGAAQRVDARVGRARIRDIPRDRELQGQAEQRWREGTRVRARLHDRSDLPQQRGLSTVPGSADENPRQGHVVFLAARRSFAISQERVHLSGRRRYAEEAPDGNREEEHVGVEPRWDRLT